MILDDNPLRTPTREEPDESEFNHQSNKQITAQDSREMISVTLPSGLSITCGSNTATFEQLVNSILFLNDKLSGEPKNKVFTGVS